MSENEIVEGWYPDPDGKPSERFWDGQRWTDQTRPQQGVTQTYGTSPSPSDGYLPDGTLKKYSAAAVWACIPLVWGLIGLICAVVAMGSTGRNGDRRGRGAAVAGLWLNILFIIIVGIGVAVNASNSSSSSDCTPGIDSSGNLVCY